MIFPETEKFDQPPGLRRRHAGGFALLRPGGRLPRDSAARCEGGALRRIPSGSLADSDGLVQDEMVLSVNLGRSGDPPKVDDFDG